MAPLNTHFVRNQDNISSGITLLSKATLIRLEIRQH